MDRETGGSKNGRGIEGVEAPSPEMGSTAGMRVSSPSSEGTGNSQHKPGYLTTGKRVGSRMGAH